MISSSPVSAIGVGVGVGVGRPAHRKPAPAPAQPAEDGSAEGVDDSAVLPEPEAREGAVESEQRATPPTYSVEGSMAPSSRESASGRVCGPNCHHSRMNVTLESQRIARSGDGDTAVVTGGTDVRGASSHWRYPTGRRSRVVPRALVLVPRSSLGGRSGISPRARVRCQRIAVHAGTRRPSWGLSLPRGGRANTQPSQRTRPTGGRRKRCFVTY